MAFGWFFLLGGEYKSLGRHTAVSALFGSNILLYREVDYFGAAAESRDADCLVAEHDSRAVEFLVAIGDSGYARRGRRRRDCPGDGPADWNRGATSPRGPAGHAGTTGDIHRFGFSAGCDVTNVFRQGSVHDDGRHPPSYEHK